MCSFILFVILSPRYVNDINPAFAKRCGGQEITKDLKVTRLRETLRRAGNSLKITKDIKVTIAVGITSSHSEQSS